MRIFPLLPFVCLVFTTFCTSKPGADTPPVVANAAAVSTAPALLLATGFPEYWYQGKAELSVYDVEQERYGEMRQAEQVNVFVTEDFSRKKQVKLDDPATAGGDRVSVLKLNSVRRFKTGIYDYSIMQSMFSPTDGTPALKSTCTVQDWCGQVFFQTNLTDNGQRRVRSFSYFEAEGDEDRLSEPAMLEDELWNRIRLNPQAIALGKQKLLPSAMFSRLRHKTFVAQNADIQMDKTEKEWTLRVNYEGLPRALSIRFEAAFPHKIMGWEEVDNARISSKGTLKSSRMEAYWSQNANAFAPLRDSLKMRW